MLLYTILTIATTTTDWNIHVRHIIDRSSSIYMCVYIREVRVRTMHDIEHQTKRTSSPILHDIYRRGTLVSPLLGFEKEGF